VGFKVPKTIYRLDFTGTELEGLEVRMRGGKLGDAFSSIQQAAGVDLANATIADAEVALSQYEDMAAHLIEWNAEDDDGNELTPDLAGLKAMEVRHVNMIAAAWQKAQVDVPSPLPHGSRNTPEPDLSSIRMEALPASLAS